MLFCSSIYPEICFLNDSYLSILPDYCHNFRNKIKLQRVGGFIITKSMEKDQIILCKQIN